MIPTFFSLLLAVVQPQGEPRPDSGPVALERSPARPSVHLEADEGMDAWLAGRLREDGYPVVDSPDAAQVELSVTARSGGGGWRVLARGESTVAFDVESAEDPAVFRLELLHRSLAALEDVEPAGSAPASDTAAVSSAGLYASTKEGVEFLLATFASRTASPTDVAPDEPAPSKEPPAEDPERPPGLEPEPEPTILRTPWFGAPRVLRGALTAGGIGRLHVADALLAVSGTFGREPGVQGWLEVQVRPVSVVGRFKVVEVQPAAGLQIRPLTIGRFSILAGGLLGPEIHAYRVDNERLSIRGRHVSASAEDMVGVAVAVWKIHELQLGVRAGSSAERIHRVDGQEIWRRNGFRYGFTLGFAFGKVIGQ